MNRRGFVSGLLALPALQLAAEEPLIYVPKRIYSLPPRQVSWTVGYIDSFETLGEVYARELAKSLNETRDRLCTNILNEAFGNRIIGPNELTAEMLEDFNRKYDPTWRQQYEGTWP